MGKFTNPFRYTPEPCVADAARLLMERIRASEELSDIFSEGKMLGVLVFRDQSGQEGFLSGFSGNAGGRSIIEGFVPPIFDLSAPEGHYRTEEKEISLINENIRTLEEDSEMEFLKRKRPWMSSGKLHHRTRISVTLFASAGRLSRFLRQSQKRHRKKRQTLKG